MWVCMTMEFHGIVLVYLVHVKLYRLCRSISQPTSPAAYLSRMAVGEVVGDPDSVSCIGVGPFVCALATGTFLCPSTRKLHRRHSGRHPAPCITSPQHHLLRAALCTPSSPQHHLLPCAHPLHPSTICCPVHTLFTPAPFAQGCPVNILFTPAPFSPCFACHLASLLPFRQ